MATRKESRKTVQAWIELRSDDPEALSALDVARNQLAAGKHLKSLRRMRLIELTGKLPARERLTDLLHGSTQFYNPHKEKCAVRIATDEVTPLRTGERAVLVFDRDGTRRAAAERWWRHETGESVEVREGTAWALAFEHPVTEDTVQDLLLVRGRRHGLLCNPHSQECRVAAEAVPLPWLEGEPTAPSDVKTRRRKPSSSPRSKR